ncbi:hypothetical protein PIB30_071549 [Stylosanthes scabra]|uniref:Uncharacterized protein n=1 Tax=Stylosanthes scabra TaxID=79078 RepID=A0ABU6ZMH7_9FABA|nr:hypothetical protein [Stylosanthes scabra]
MEGVHADEAPEFDFGMMKADFLSLGLPGPSYPTPDTQAGSSHSAPLMMQLHIEFVPAHVYHPQASTPDLDQIPENYTQWCAEMFGQSSYQPVPDHSSWGTPIQQSEPFAHMSDSIPPSAYEARLTELSDSEDSGDVHQIRGHIEGRLVQGHRETRPPPCGTGGSLDGRVVRRGRGRGGP